MHGESIAKKAEKPKLRNSRLFSSVSKREEIDGESGTFIGIMGFSVD